MVIFNITLVRHGETSHNKECVIQGQLDVPLSPVGEKQCELLGKHLQAQRFTHIYASDLRRAKQTAEIIAKHNQYFKGSIIEDKRLRERKFGEVEGKSFSFLKEAAQKAKQLLTNYTPKGAETTKQVYERASLFFQELCKMVLSSPALKEDESEAKLLSDHKVEKNNNSAEYTSSTNKRKRECSCDFPNKVECSLTNLPTNNVLEEPQLCIESKSTPSLAALKLENASENGSNDLNEPLSILVNGSNGSQPREGSVASSNDVMAPQLAANILVVAHGGSLKEMIRYFLEELKCAIPGGRGQALRISPNTGLSKFTISLNNEDTSSLPTPVVFCHLIHDKQHLASICTSSTSSISSSTSSLPSKS